MKIGVIADDFTGATDAASFIAKAGMEVVQFSGVPNTTPDVDYDALVVSLKSRSCPANLAIEQSLAACQWLLEQGCEQIYFKYCSTFDSTKDGNIGPVIDALMSKLKVSTVTVCPALPINGRTLYQGHLFVFDTLLSESGMRHHPITPMKEANVLRLLDSQTQGEPGLLPLSNLLQGVESTANKLQQLTLAGKRYVVCDSVNDDNLVTIAKVAAKHRLLTGGSGLVGALACHHQKQKGCTSHSEASFSQVHKGVVLSGSCSLITNQQVALYQALAPHYKLDVERCLTDAHYIDEVVTWVTEHSEGPFFPLVYATVAASELSEIQQRFGEQASIAVEALFSQLVARLYQQGFNTYISAGGETSGTVTQALSIESFRIRTEIAPGVPWVQSLNGEINLALKSGNFGQKNFFELAQDMLR